MFTWIRRVLGKPKSASRADAAVDTGRIEELIRCFDEGDPAAERAHLELSHMGGAAIPALVRALQGGTNRRFYAARTIGKIGIDAQCGLVSLDESAREAALAAVNEALRRETLEPVRISLLRAQRNCSKDS